MHAHIKGVFVSLFVFSLLWGRGNILMAFVIASMGVAFSFLLVFPAFVLGIFASKALLNRGITHWFIWMVASTVIGASWMFFLAQDLLYLAFVCAPFIGLFMSRYACRAVREIKQLEEAERREREKVNLKNARDPT